MSLNYDLHSHSTASDGSLTPGQLVALATERGVDVLALTDHDTVAGLAEARAAATESAVELIDGIELSVTWEGQTIHVVGLGIDPEAPELVAGLARMREFRIWRGEEMARRLEKAGIPGAYEGARAYAHGPNLSRTHFAQFLVANGHARDVRRVFKRFMKPGKPGHVPGQWADLEEAMGWLRAAGGEAVIAHPARYGLTRRKLLRLFGEFRELGGDAIEVVSGSHDPDGTARMAAEARGLGFRASRGSDYHGPEKSWAELGRVDPLPSGCTPIWEAWEVSGRRPGAESIAMHHNEPCPQP